eukprot:7378553-Prymnesium_polylepis.1
MLLHSGATSDCQRTALHLACELYLNHLGTENAPSAAAMEGMACTLITVGKANPRRKGHGFVVSSLNRCGVEDAAAQAHLDASPARVLRKCGAAKLADTLLDLYTYKGTSRETKASRGESGDDTAMDVVDDVDEAAAGEAAKTGAVADAIVDDAVTEESDTAIEDEEEEDESDDDDNDDDERFWCDEEDDDLLFQLMSDEASEYIASNLSGVFCHLQEFQSTSLRPWLMRVVAG